MQLGLVHSSVYRHPWWECAIRLASWNDQGWIKVIQGWLLQLMSTSLLKVICEEGRVAALSHTYAVKSPLVSMARPKFAPKSTPSRGPIPKPHYLPHPWTRPTFDAKRHPNPIRRFSTIHWTDRRTYGHTNGPTDRPRESLIAIGRGLIITNMAATYITRTN